MPRPFLACDWGTTNLRAWVIGEGGEPGPEREFPSYGVARLQPGEPAARFVNEVRPTMVAQEMPALLCGMIGSTLGWTVAPYVDAPADLSDLVRGLVTVQPGEAPVRIVPGVRGPGFNGGFDVMRGEEVQVFGWVAQDPARARGRHVICHPGTHAKWILVEDGRLVRFVTAMTGELFDVLRKNGVLKNDAPADDADAFIEGVDAAGDGGGLSARLFTTRARVVAGGARPESSPSYLSGLLIGAEIAALPALLGVDPCREVALVGEPRLCRLYRDALSRKGVETTVDDGDAAVLAGLKAIADAGGVP